MWVPRGLAPVLGLAALGAGCQLITGTYSVGGGELGAECTYLATCCSSLASAEQNICLTIVSTGDDSACSDELQIFPDGVCTTTSTLPSLDSGLGSHDAHVPPGSDGQAPQGDQFVPPDDQTSPPEDHFVPEDSEPPEDSGEDSGQQGSEDPPDDLAGAWTLQDTSCDGSDTPIEGWSSTFTVDDGDATWESEFEDGCDVTVFFSGVTYTDSGIAYEQSEYECGSSCTFEDGDPCNDGTTDSGSGTMSYTVSGGTLDVTLSSADFCDEGDYTITGIQE